MSLAEANGRVAVGVLLSGLGLDGTAGVMALKEQGGLLVCERDERGAGGEMQLLTDPAGLADFVLAAEEIVPRVGQYMRHLRESSARRDEQAAEQGIADQISRIAAVLRQRTGHDFHGYKHGTFLRRIARRMQVNAIDAVERYIDFLREDADEVHHLFQDLLIGVTHFFRSGRPRAVSEMQLGRQAERVVERHAPAYLLVDPRFEVLSFSGRTGAFWSPRQGQPTLTC